MLNHELRFDDEILVIHPEEPLEAADFTALANLVDAYLEKHGVLRGVLIRAQSFPGWKNFGALLAHLKFVQEHHQRIKKVAIVADGAFANIMPQLANHFVHAEIRHFELVNEDAAWGWLRQTGKVRMRAVA